MLKLQEIEKLHIELTTKCNARCPMCMRNYRGLDYNSGYPVTELSLAQIKHILKPEFLKQLKIINFNGNLGDFGVARDAQEIVHYIIDHDVQVLINTNGSMRTPAWWADLAHPRVRIGWALDGLSDVHHLYRQDTNWHRIIENAQAFIAAGGYAMWRFIPFEHNLHQEADCRRLAKEMGFKEFEILDGGRNQGPVYTRTGEFSHWLGKQDPEKLNNPPSINGMLESHITWFDHRTIQHPNDTMPFRLICEHKRQKEIYLAANGEIYPCCFLGFYPGQMTHPGNQQMTHMVKENNALEYDLAHCLNWFESVEQSWQQPSIAQGRLYQCVASCGGRS